MCKVIIVTNTGNIKNLGKFADNMQKLLQGQKDGYGYAIQNADGSVFGGRTLRPTEPLVNGNAIPWCANFTETFGEIKAGLTRAALFHGRTSTNNVSLINTHPISKNGWHLIHNGVVQDTAEGASVKARLTSNDSEFLLDHMISGGIEAVETHLTGYYAGGVFSPDGTLHVFRDKIAKLQCAWSAKLNTFIFATTEDLIESIGKLIKENLLSSPVNEDTYLKFQNGQCVEHLNFVSRGYTAYEAKWASSSLGYHLPAISSVPKQTKKMDTDSVSDVDLIDMLSEEFLEILDAVDDSYTIKDEKGRDLTAMVFYNMTLKDQVKCTVKDMHGKKVRKYLNKEERAVGYYGKSMQYMGD